jgi:hypothetical protein
MGSETETFEWIETGIDAETNSIMLDPAAAHTR